MSATKATATAASATPEKVPPRGEKAGAGKYVFELARINQVDAGPDYSTATGSIVEGERFMMGLMRMPKGTGARPHSHPNEQWVYMIEGTLLVEVDGVKAEAKPGSLVYFPPNSVHSSMATTDRDAVFITAKDLSHGLWGTAVDQSTSGPRYAPGFAPSKSKG
jgi:quercetin dioxygenase-like cupin family protein